MSPFTSSIRTSRIVVSRALAAKCSRKALTGCVHWFDDPQVRPGGCLGSDHSDARDGVGTAARVLRVWAWVGPGGLAVGAGCCSGGRGVLGAPESRLFPPA